MSPSIEQLPVQKFDTVLSQSLGNDIEIKHLEWRPLTAPGENFGSVMLAITVTLSRGTDKTETLNLVTKLPPTTTYLLELFNSPVTFKKELLFYSSMAKEFVTLQLENGVSQENLCMLLPKFLGGRLGLKNIEEFDEQAAIVLENLKCIGYDTEDRIFGLNKKHTEFAIVGLAKLHALAVALKIKKPRIYEKIATEVLADVLNAATERCVIDMLRKAQSDIQTIDEVKPYLDRVNRTIEHGIQENKIPQKPEEPWGTLIHNDFWVNNMMFKHENGEPVDIKIVDFQLCVYDYGVKDLIFFLLSSTNKDILDNKLDDMIDLYYDNFIHFLKTLKVDTEKFSKEKFYEILNQCAPLKFNQCIMMVQVIQAPRGGTPNLQEVKGNDVFAGKIGDGICKQKLIHIVKVFNKKGWLIK